MAQSVHLNLEIDGNRIEGESTVTSMEREGTIECSSYEYELITHRDPGSLTVAKRQHGAVTFAKKIDKSTPLLLKALCKNEPITRAEFRFFRPNPKGDGTEEQFYTVLLEGGFVSSVEQLSEDAIVGGPSVPPMMERVSFVFASITWTYEDNGAEYRERIGKR